jgi:hypothetical protein
MCGVLTRLEGGEAASRARSPIGGGGAAGGGTSPFASPPSSRVSTPRRIQRHVSHQRVEASGRYGARPASRSTAAGSRSVGRGRPLEPGLQSEVAALRVVVPLPSLRPLRAASARAVWSSSGLEKHRRRESERRRRLEREEEHRANRVAASCSNPIGAVLLLSLQPTPTLRLPAAVLLEAGRAPAASRRDQRCVSESSEAASPLKRAGLRACCRI